MLRIGMKLPNRPFYNDPKKNYNEDVCDEEDDTEENIPQKINLAEEVSSFFSFYIPIANEGLLKEEDFGEVEQFFVLAGYKNFSHNIEIGKRDMEEYFSNQE